MAILKRRKQFFLGGKAHFFRESIPWLEIASRFVSPEAVVYRFVRRIAFFVRHRSNRHGSDWLADDFVVLHKPCGLSRC